MVIPHFDHKFLILLQMQFSGVAKQILVQNANNVKSGYELQGLPFIYSYIYNLLQITCNEICISKQYVFLLHSFLTSALNMVILSDL